MTVMADASKLVTEALQAAALTAKALARRMKISDSALRRYGYGDRTPPPPLLNRLARLLRQHARYLQRLSGALGQLARKQQKTLWLQRRGGRRRGREKKTGG